MVKPVWTSEIEVMDTGFLVRLLRSKRHRMSRNFTKQPELSWCCQVRRELTSSCAMERISHEALVTAVLEEMNGVNKTGLGNLA